MFKQDAVCTWTEKCDRDGPGNNCVLGAIFRCAIFFCHFNISLIGCCWQPSKLQTVFSAHIVQCDIKWCILHWWVGEKWNKEGRAWLFLRIVEEKVRPCEGRWGEPGYQEAMRVKGGQKGQVEVKVYQPYTVTSNWEMLGGPGSHFDMLNG